MELGGALELSSATTKKGLKVKGGSSNSHHGDSCG